MIQTLHLSQCRRTPPKNSTRKERHRDSDVLHILDSDEELIARVYQGMHRVVRWAIRLHESPVLRCRSQSSAELRGQAGQQICARIVSNQACRGPTRNRMHQLATCCGMRVDKTSCYSYRWGRSSLLCSWLWRWRRRRGAPQRRHGCRHRGARRGCRCHGSPWLCDNCSQGMLAYGDRRAGRKHQQHWWLRSRQTNHLCPLLNLGGSQLV